MTTKSTLVTVAALAAVLLAGCGSAGDTPAAAQPSGATGTSGAAAEAASAANLVLSSNADPTAESETASGSADETATSDETSSDAFPFTTQNCGVPVSIEAAPQRILAIKSTSLELLLALGAGDRVVGSAFLDGPVPDEWAAQADLIPLISDKVPSEEPVLELAPDLIVAGWESNFAADTTGTRESLTEKGIASYVSPAACQSADQPARLTYSELFDEFTEFGRVIGEPAAAAALVDQQREELADVVHTRPGTTALWWSSGTKTPYVGGGIGAPEMVMAEVGLTNIAADIDQTWTSLGWESIIDANPDVIVLIDADWNTAEKKMADLKGNPATAQMDAVQNERYVVIPFPASEAGVRSVQAAIDLGQQLAALGLGG